MKYSDADLDLFMSELLSSGTSVRLQVRGGSMRPFVKNGDTLCIQHCELSRLRRGDIVVYRRQERLIAHRLVSAVTSGEGTIIAAGDFFLSPTHVVPWRDVLGKISGIERQEKYLDFDSGRRRLAGCAWQVVRRLATPLYYAWLKLRHVLRLGEEPARFEAALPEHADEVASFLGYDCLPDAEDMRRELAAQLNDLAGGVTILARAEQGIAGCVSIGRATSENDHPDTWRLSGLLVQRAYRRRGIGERLCRIAVALALSQGAQKVSLWVQEKPPRSAARRLYAKMGFRRLRETAADAHGRICLVATEQTQAYVARLAQKHRLIRRAAAASRRHLWLAAIRPADEANTHISRSYLVWPAFTGSGRGWFEQICSDGLAGFVYRIGEKSEVLRVLLGPLLWAKCERAYYATLGRNILVKEQSAKILADLYRARIPVIVLKGPHLAEDLYGDCGVRPCADMDVLVRRSDLSKAHAVLCAHGFQPPPYYEDAAGGADTQALNSLVYQHAQDALPSMHVHWHIINSTWPLAFWVRQIRMEEIWQQAILSSLDGTAGLRLALPHMLVYLIMHAVTHGFDRLLLWRDIVAAATRYEKHASWPDVFSAAERFRINALVYAVLRELTVTGSRDIPGLEAFGRRIKAVRLFATVGCDWRFGYADGYRLWFKMCPEGGEKFKFLLRTLWPNRFVIAQSRGLRGADVRVSHYIQRLFADRHHSRSAFTIPGSFNSDAGSPCGAPDSARGEKAADSGAEAPA